MKFFQIMRPAHWTKSVFVFAGLVFGKKLVGTGPEVAQAVGQALDAFVGFCLISSAVYIFNDLMDRETDQMHPETPRPEHVAKRASDPPGGAGDDNRSVHASSPRAVCRRIQFRLASYIRYRIKTFAESMTHSGV